MKLSWKPRKYGNHYCAPACGRGCTLAEYESAKEGATRLAVRLGKGWKPRVWENLGWHYSATLGKSAVYPRSARSFWASIEVGMQFTATATTPKKAVQKAMLSCNSFMARIQKEYAALKARKETKKGGT